MNHPDLQWFTTPIHLPFPFLPLPSFAATFVVAALSCAILCIGMWLIPTRWPFAKIEPTFPGGSPIWWMLAVLLSLAAGIGAWKLGQPGDLAVACTWYLVCFTVLVICARNTSRRPAGTLLRTGASKGDSAARRESSR